LRVLSAVSRVELSCVIEGRKGEAGRVDLERMLNDGDFEVVAVTPQQAMIAVDAFNPVERGASRPGGDTLRRPANAFDVTSGYLLERAPDDAARAQVADQELLRQFQEVERLPDEDKHVMKTLLQACYEDAARCVPDQAAVANADSLRITPCQTPGP